MEQYNKTQVFLNSYTIDTFILFGYQEVIIKQFSFKYFEQLIYLPGFWILYIMAFTFETFSPLEAFYFRW